MPDCLVRRVAGENERGAIRRAAVAIVDRRIVSEII